MSRVVTAVDDGKLVTLHGGTHPLARPEFDRGPVASDQALERVVLVLQRSPEQEKALAAFNERQYDPASPDFHHWLHAEEFGKLYGPSDSDMNTVKSWLESRGMTVGTVSKGRVTIEFTGTVAQVETAFHVGMHKYLVDGKEHLANDRDPSIPEALAPVVAGVASLNNFFPKHYSHPGDYVKRDLKTGTYSLMAPGPESESALRPSLGAITPNPAKKAINPQLGYIDPSTGFVREELSPYDVAAIYNILPLWKQSTPINGKGVKVAIVGLSDVKTSDFNTYRSSFGLPSSTLVTVHSGSDPGYTDSQGENTEDTEMVSATAPGATVVMVAEKSTATTDGLILGIGYIAEKEIAPIMTVSYGACELGLGTAGNKLWNSTFQQAATAGISAFVASGDSGSSVCTSQNGQAPYADTFGLAVSGLASTPYATAVGGTDLQWPLVGKSHAYTTYWNTKNDSHGASAKGYMPEMAWNDTCTNTLLPAIYGFSNVESLCEASINENPGLVEMGGGGGGVSKCTTSSGGKVSSCSGGYAKPKWQAGVTGIPADGKRDVPDVSMFAAYGFQRSTGIPGSALLICQASNSPNKSCDFKNPNYIIYQENGGTSASSPLTAGVMALVLQKVGKKQGLANPVFYSLAAKQDYAACNSNTVKAGNSCVFYDTTTGSNAMVCIGGGPNCVRSKSSDQVGVINGYSTTKGFDRATGLGSFNVTNLVNAWPKPAAPAAKLSVTSLAFATTKVAVKTAAKTITLTNSGTATMTISSIALGGTNATSFLISAKTCGSSLAAAKTCTISVEFKPTAKGARTAYVALTDNAAGSPQKVTLTGTGD